MSEIKPRPDLVARRGPDFECWEVDNAIVEIPKDPCKGMNGFWIALIGGAILVQIVKLFFSVLF